MSPGARTSHTVQASEPTHLVFSLVALQRAPVMVVLASRAASAALLRIAQAAAAAKQREPPLAHPYVTRFTLSPSTLHWSRWWLLDVPQQT